MPQSLYSPRGRVCGLLPLLTSALLLAGCNGGSSGTAEFPDMGTKPKMTNPPPKKPAKGMDRVGSEAAAP
jgi:hypothetical protein